MTQFNLIKIDPETLDEEILEYGTIECMECEFDGPIPVQYFKVQPEVENEEDYNELKGLIQNQLGYSSFTETGDENGMLVSVCRCPKCGSEEIFQDL